LLAAGASGVLLALAFPRPGLGALAWVGLVPLLLVAGQRPFRSGIVAGFVYFAAVLSWVTHPLTRYGGLPWAPSVLLYLLLAGYLALYVGAVTWATCRLTGRLGAPRWLAFPVLWVGAEHARSFLLTGFPWALLGYSQQGSLVLLQSADLAGPFGLSFLLALANAVAADAIRALGGRPRRPLPWGGIGALALLLALTWGYGAWRLDREPEAAGQPLRVAVVQGNVEQAVKWDPSFQRETIDRYTDLSVGAETERPHLIVWPETAVPFRFDEREPLAEEVRGTARETGAFLLFGAPRRQLAAGEERYFNSAFLLGPGGESAGVTDKVHLVPFGEYVPLQGLLPFAEKLVAGAGDFSPGRAEVLPAGKARLGVLVCFEAIFPALARDLAARGADLLVNLTNDGWFGDTAAPYQHLGMARFRAVENRVWLVRAANTGISALVDPAGRIVGSLPLFQADRMDGVVRVGASRSTGYQGWGGRFPAGCLVLSLAGLTATVVVGRRPGPRLQLDPGL
jgi:apolipoprotein N-acyltransferase